MHYYWPLVVVVGLALCWHIGVAVLIWWAIDACHGMAG